MEGTLAEIKYRMTVKDAIRELQKLPKDATFDRIGGHPYLTCYFMEGEDEPNTIDIWTG